MVSVERTFTVPQPLEAVVAYLADFAHAEAWDPGTVSCTRVGAETRPVVGSTWHNVSVFNGRQTELEYRLTTLEPAHLVFTGTNKTATSTDDITFGLGDGGTTITYRATIVFNGWAKLAGPFLQRSFEKVADETVEQMTRTLATL